MKLYQNCGPYFHVSALLIINWPTSTVSGSIETGLDNPGKNTDTDDDYVEIKDSEDEELNKSRDDNENLNTGQEYVEFPLVPQIKGDCTCIKVSSLEAYIGHKKHTDTGLKKEFTV